MNIDFHTHIKLSKKSSFSPKYCQEMVTEAKAVGLDAFALTEHFNTSNFLEVYDYLDSQFPYQEDYYSVEGLKIFPGMEVDVKEIGHILIISRRESILEMFHHLKPHLEENNFIPFSDLMNLTESFDVIKIGGHPFRPGTPLTQHEPEQLKRLDALDLNGKDLHSLGIEVNQEKVYRFAEELGLPVVGGSDTHQYLQYGSVVNTFDIPCSTISELKKAIENKQYAITISPDLHLRVKSASLTKKLMKELLVTKSIVC
ncbi:PHP domain-containing protein [Heyndrickxia sporothermodurans]|uniref:PHP domain-containing protein n=1 Tax=Heyndrickxia sporothermodurans TaxID=46224 RepID=A0AB37HJW5_9BACI|nr:PHP domain-containing protein [Heyndrickxia sporothermodurans]MBL5767884.1 PHP domain-containing protein [Heyndrickxia sporothermodurans]MBL5771484.1 PHP domain-containing protein [Heyndrickxia sporothermodurans]MBL5775145.1 PHP domain-containing protein [Heyndrickxia sporothermodurans]MBL5778588.1 PHP domain-containing protein [Heyndrickxia sporothermodurans]MBL5782163.1 PHP domain-containing protein [Heyndrickxia sporothermodurans]